MSRASIREVVDDLRQHGVRAGRQEAARIVADAEHRADTIVADARAQAARIVADAEADARTRATRLDVELTLAASAATAALHRELEASLLVPTVADAVTGLLDDPTALAHLLVEATRALASGRAREASLDVTVAPRHRDAAEADVVRTALDRLGDGVRIRIDDALDGGFRIAVRDRAYQFDFTDDALRELLLTWLAPRFRHYFFAGAED